MIFDDHTDEAIFRSILAEAAKATNELRCAKNDLNQVDVRLRFILATINHLQQRYEDIK